jgi:hypothetical protein
VNKELLGTAIIYAIISFAPALADDERTLYKEISAASGDAIPYAVYLPVDFDAAATYPVLVGPGDAVPGAEPGFYWRTNPHSRGWIIVDAQIWDSETQSNIDAVLDAVATEFNIEGGKFHAVCWSANSAGIFRLITDHADRFHSITGMAGNPSRVSSADIAALQHVKVQFIVGENDRYWQKSARDAHDKLVAGGVDSVFEIVPNGEHVMTNLVGAGFMQKLEKLR